MPIYRMRNDWVLVRLVDRGISKGGVAIPQVSKTGKDMYIEAVGPEVKDLKKGQKVLLSGLVNADYFPLPESNSLIATQQKNVVLQLFEDEEGGEEVDQ